MPSLRTNGADPQQNTHTARPILEERRELGHTHTARAGLEEERRELVLQESRELGHAFAEHGRRARPAQDWRVGLWLRVEG